MFVCTCLCSRSSVIVLFPTVCAWLQLSPDQTLQMKESTPLCLGILHMQTKANRNVYMCQLLGQWLCLCASILTWPFQTGRATSSSAPWSWKTAQSPCAPAGESRRTRSTTAEVVEEDSSQPEAHFRWTISHSYVHSLTLSETLSTGLNWHHLKFKNKVPKRPKKCLLCFCRTRFAIATVNWHL